jgi:tRNA pseudouridine55 synthase
MKETDGPVNGLLIVDKPSGMTSHDVVNRLRRITAEKSIGHLGTLDPMATGVLPLLMGKFTRLAQYFSSAEKTYSGSIRLGFATDTYDAEGQPAGPDCWPEMSSSLTFEQVRAAALPFHGEIEQMPPPFSAKKIEGTPAYKLARQGKAMELKPAKIRISSFEIVSLEGAEAAFTMTVSAGGYVRSVAHEMGQALGCGAHLSQLRRTQAGIFSIDQARTLAELESAAGNPESLESLCIHPRCILPEMPPVSGDELALSRLRNGAQANLPEFSQAPLVKVFAGQRDLVGIARRIAGTLFQPVVVLG